MWNYEWHLQWKHRYELHIESLKVINHMSSNAINALSLIPLKPFPGVYTLMVSMPIEDARLYWSCNLLIPGGTSLVSQK
jgi:hypothetical protein